MKAKKRIAKTRPAKEPVSSEPASDDWLAVASASCYFPPSD
jgi:hypothetical protein